MAAFGQAGGGAAPDSGLTLVVGADNARMVAGMAGYGAFHHAGLGGDSDDPELLLRRWMEALKQRFAIAEPVPLGFAAMRETLPNWLARAAAGGGFCLTVADAHCLRDDIEDEGFAWLPDWLPQGVSIVVGAAATPFAQLLRTHADRLQEAESDQAAPSLPDDAGARELLALLWVARGGLTPEDAAMVMADAAAARAAAGDCVQEGDGHWLLADAGQRECVARQLLSAHGTRQQLHERLAAHFSSRTELQAQRLAAWHWRAAGRADTLRALLLSPAWLAAMNDAVHAFETLRLWRRIAEGEALRTVAEAREVTPEVLLGTAHLLDIAGDEPPPLAWLQRAGALAEAAGNTAQHARALEAVGTHPDCEPQTAQAALERALALRLEAEDVGAGAVEGARHRLACHFEARGDLRRAATHYEAGLQARAQRLGNDAPALIPWLSNLAAALASAGQLEAALPHYERALRIARAGLGERHPGTAACCDHLAGCAYAGSDYERAETLYREALSITEAGFGPAHPATAAGLHNLGTCLDALQRYREAEDCHRRALAIRQQVFGEQHMDTATSLHNLAAVLDATDALDEAERLYRRALDIWQAVTGEQHPAFATTLNNLAELLGRRGAWADAEPLFRAAVETWRGLYGDEHPHTLMSLQGLARLYVDGGKPELAEPLLAHLVDVTAEVTGGTDSQHIDAVCLLAALLRDSGRQQAARELLVETLAAAEGTLGMIAPRVQKLRRQLDSLDASKLH